MLENNLLFMSLVHNATSDMTNIVTTVTWMGWWKKNNFNSISPHCVVLRGVRNRSSLGSSWKFERNRPDAFVHMKVTIFDIVSRRKRKKVRERERERGEKIDETHQKKKALLCAIWFRAKNKFRLDFMKVIFFLDLSVNSQF